MRLIDADKLIYEIKNCLWDWESINGITATTVLKQTISDIESQPTVYSEEQEAVGTTIETAVYDKGSLWYICCACRQGVNYKTNYCQNCGRRLKWDDEQSKDY